jgi:hypothetical protein
MHETTTKRGAALLIAATALLGISGVYAGPPPAEPVDLLITFDAVGRLQGFNPATFETTYLISAKGTVPDIRPNGQIIARKPERRHKHDDSYTVVLDGAAITFGPFDPVNPPPIVDFSCRGCTLTFPDGSTLVSDPDNVPLQGRALFVYGPVAPDPATPIATIRMMGCAGLREVAGKGAYANKVGSICFNGEFNFDVSDPTTIPATLTGSSGCTIVLHTPVVPLPPLGP